MAASPSLERLETALLDGLGIARAILAGYDWGGRAGHFLPWEAPDAVAEAVLSLASETA